MMDPALAVPLRYRPALEGRRHRGMVIAGIVLAHAALLWLLLAQAAGASRHPGAQGLNGAGRQVVFDLRTANADSGNSRSGGGEASSDAVPVPGTEPRVVTRRGAGDADRPGEINLGDRLAGVLAEDPLAGGGLADYEAILRLHIAAHSQGMRERLVRPGVVLLRFRVARDGTVVDAQVVRSPAAALGELALSALWNSEPLPGVPDHLSAPLQVDVPLDFRVGG